MLSAYKTFAHFAQSILSMSPFYTKNSVAHILHLVLIADVNVFWQVYKNLKYYDILMKLNLKKRRKFASAPLVINENAVKISR